MHMQVETLHTTHATELALGPMLLNRASQLIQESACLCSGVPAVAYPCAEPLTCSLAALARAKEKSTLLCRCVIVMIKVVFTMMVRATIRHLQQMMTKVA